MLPFWALWGCEARPDASVSGSWNLTIQVVTNRSPGDRDQTAQLVPIPYPVPFVIERTALTERAP